MNFLKWIGACLTVYIRRLGMLDNMSLIKVFILAFVLLLAASLGLPATVFLLIVAVFVLPALNSNIKREIDDEYTKRK
jgi:hypothetical protein